MGKYPKLNQKELCAFPDREICNYEDTKGIVRCQYMKYDRTKTIFDADRWKCTYKKELHK